MPKPIDTLRPALFVFSWLYGFIVFIRNKFYDCGVFKSHEFQIPVICVGNITVGGTGKTPHVEYLVRRYKEQYNLAVLSRGYGRKTKGFRYVRLEDSAKTVGDEPLQMKQKYSDVTFAVDEKRARGIQKLQDDGYDLVILDDAFQHRAVKAFKSVVLMDYNRLPSKDYYLPSGNLREGRYALKRADSVLVTKCPQSLSDSDKKEIVDKNKITKPVFFTHFEYGKFYSFEEKKLEGLLKDNGALLVTGIANPKPLIKYVEACGAEVSTLSYPDHYDFKIKDLQKIGTQFDKLLGQRKIILTTEKDKVKLLPLLKSDKKLLSHFYYIPIQVAFEQNRAADFHKLLGI